MTQCNTPAMRYHGAKFRLYSWIRQFIPCHMRYVEPFGGAAGILIQKPPSAQDVYNDLDGEMVNFFTVVRNSESRAKLIEALALTPYARTEFKLAFESDDCPIERARRTCIRAQMGFGSAGANRGATGFRTDTARKCATSMALWQTFPDTISRLGLRMSGVLIENRDASRVINDHDGKDVLFFVDPPYLHSTRVSKGYSYAYEMSDADHLALINQLKSVAGMVILCGYDSDLYRDTLSGWRLEKTASRASAHRGTKLAMEHIWLNPACVAALGNCDEFRLEAG